MLYSLYQHVVFIPIYNTLIFLMDIIPWGDAGIAVILVTIIVRLILFPLSKKAVVTQLRMKEVEPELNELKTKYKDDKQLQARKVMEIYKEKGINPLSSIFLLFIQLPIIIGLYNVFQAGLPTVNTAILYSFVQPPTVNLFFLGILDVSKFSWAMTLIAAFSQFVQIHFSSASKVTPLVKGEKPTFQQELGRSMAFQMKFIFPVVLCFMAFKLHLSTAVTLYWTVTNLFTLGQELVIRRQIKTPKA